MTYDLGVFKRQRYVYPTFNAVGGTISYYTSNGVAYTVHTFLSGTSTFAVFSTATVDILLVGGGASGISNGYGGQYGAGGNAGQVQTTSTALNIGQYTVIVGAGGAGNQTGSFATGSNTSIVGTINVSFASTATGATSGGGASPNGGGNGAGGSRNGNSGGVGVANNYATGLSTYYGGGGGAYDPYVSNGTGGTGGGGGAGGVSATPNTGGGGGGSGDAYISGGFYYPSGSGGSGIVVIRYPTPINSIIPINDIYFNYVSLLLSNQTTNVTTPTPITANVITKIEYIAVGGGGAGGSARLASQYELGGGGGAGGVVYGTLTNILLSSLNTIVVTVGSGGSGVGVASGNNGNNSSIVNTSIWNFTTSSIIAYGGGGGGLSSGGNNEGPAGSPGGAGGSGGGGGGASNFSGGVGAAGTSIQTSKADISLGNSGGAGQTRPASIIAAFGGSGGGAGGGGATGTLGTAAAAGAGYTWLNGTTYAAGGASGASSAAGTAYTGNGGGGASKGGSSAGTNTAGGGGGGGVVVFRYIGTNVLATGGTISTVSNYVYHTFQSSGALTAIETLSSTSTVTLSSPINYLLVGGGGGAGVVNFSNTPGGGGAGGLFTGTFTITNITNLLSITVGAGGGIRGTGGNSSITSNYVTKTAYGGGAGADGGDGGAGGSGGGAGGSNSGSGAAAAGGTNLNGPGTAAGGYGNLGGSGSSGAYGGGGGAGGAGQSFGPDGGIGLYINNPYSAYSTTYATGGAGGGGAAQTASPNTGNGGGANGGTGGSGISILWEPSSNPMPSVIGAPTIVTTGSYRVYVFTSTGGLVYGNLLSNTKFTDNSTNSYPILYNGNTSQGSFNPYAKNWSVYFNGSSYLSIPNSASYGTTRLNLDSNSNFTIEGWAYFNSVSAGMLIAHEYTIWRIGVASGTLQYSLSSNGSNYAGIASSISMGTVVVGRWYHFALVRNGSTFTPYLNGIAGTPTISSASLYAGTNEGLTIGMGDTNNYFSGYLSNIRILKGTAFYTAPFTPAISPLPLVSNTLLLTCSNSTWDDVSDYNWSIIPKGIPAVKKFSPFSNFGSYNPTLVGGSAYFNGTTDYLTISTTSTTNVPNWTYLHDGTTDYTIEGWIYPLSTATQQGLIGTSDISNTAVSGMALYLTSGGVLSWAIMNGSASFPSGTVSNSVKPNAWNHVACTFASSSKITNIYINGFKLSTTATTTSSFTATSASYPLTIGRSAVSTLNTYSGYISNLRILKGVISDGVVTNNIGIGKTLEYLVVAGGGGAPAGGGGGGGGFRTGTFVTTQTGIIYTVTVGNGGAAGVAGGNSSLVGGSLNFVSAGGGYGSISGAGGAGGSGGGSGAAGGTGNTPATVPAQGYNGGTGSGGSAGYGGGGGATSAGFERGGGDGALSNIDGLGYYYSGGGGGLGGGYTGGSGGIGGGGYGTGYNWGNGGGGSRGTASSTSGFSNSGGGGGTNGAGGSGIVIIRYLGPQRATGGNIITTNISGYTVHTFLSSGVFTDNMPSYTLPVAPVAASSTATNLLLNFTDSVIVDASSNTDIYTGGDSGLASLVKKYNNMSMYFDGTTGTGLTISTSSAVALGFSDFTVEMWMYPLASYNSGNAPALLDARTTGDGAGLIRFGFNGTTIYGGPQIAWRENVTSIVTATVILNVWQHIAVVRNSGVITMYNNGTAISSTSNSTDLIVPFKYIAQTYNNLSFSGYIDDLRITNGIARYTTAFIPPIQKLQLK